MADVPISGAIDPAAFPFLLIDLHRNGATGSLKVAGPSYQKALYFRAGRILFGSSNDPRDQLGAILIESGKITPEQLEDVNAKVGPGSPLAKVLTETGFVNQRELSEAARAKVERILSDIVVYEDGSFEFEDGVLPKGAVDLKLSTERVVVAAVRRVTDRNFVLRYIDGMEVVLRGTNDVAVPFAEIETDTSGITHYLDGARTLKEAASLARLDDFEAAKIACALLFLGAVERVPMVDLGEVAAAAQGAPPPTPPVAEAPAIELSAAEAPAAEPPPIAPAFVAPPSDEPPFMIPTTDAPPVFGMESAADDEIRVASTEAPVVLMEPESTVIMAPAPAEPAPFVEPPVAPPIAPPPPVAPAPAPARRQYDVPLVPPPPRPAPAPVATVPALSRPSEEDLAALDQILGSRNETSGGLDKSVAAAASRPTSRSAGGKSSTAGRSARRSAPSKAPIFLGLGAALALAGAAAWFFVLRPRSEAAEARVAPPAPVTTAPAAPGGTVTEPASATTVPAALPPPVSVPASTLAAAPAGDARALLQGGRYPEAAQLFADDLKAAGQGAATVQLLIACSAETVQKAVDNVGAMELVIVPHRYGGRDCYRLCWGIYSTAQAATAASRALPPYFTQSGVRPRVMRAAEILP